MFKLFKNFLPAESVHNPDSAIATSESESENAPAWQNQIAQADAFWEQGKFNEALAIYGLALKAHPNLLEIQQHLAGRLKQQGDLAIAYEKLATGLKNQGEIEQAANYYRQAIHLKTLTGSTKEQLLRSSVSMNQRTPIPIASLKETAFSFQPLVSANAQLVKPRPAVKSWSELELNACDHITPSFSPRLKAINPQQAKDIDWETAQVYLQKALDHLEKEEWKESAVACQQATKILPDMAEAYKIWGNALQRMGNTAEAMSCYAKAVEIKPNLAEVYAGLADIYRQQDKLQQAVKHYQKAIIIKPSAEIYRKLAEVWQQLNDSEQAKLNWQKALELETASGSSSVDDHNLNSTAITPQASQLTRSVEIYCKMARELEAQQEWKQAAKYYRKALDISLALPALPASKVSPPIPMAPNKSQSTTVTIAKSSKKNYPPETQLDKAIKRYYKQSKLQPNSPKIHTDLGNLYTKKGKWQYAIACYRKAIDLKPQYANAHLNLGRALFKVGKQQEFIREMELALSLQPRIGTALDRFYLGNALVDRGQYQQAIGFYYKAIVLNPQFVAAYHRMSEVLSKQGKHQQAIEFLQQGIEQNPQEAESFYLLGQQFELLQNWDSAVKTYSKVLQLEPQFPGASQKLNHALAEKLKSNYR